MKNPASLNFGHPPETIQVWKRLVREALLLSLTTPLYVFSSEPVAERIADLDAALDHAGMVSAIENRQSKIAYRHWLSCKTNPVASMLRWWRQQGGGIEVVSEFELRAALAEGFLPENILINGPAKQHWLPQFELRELSVNFDSTAETATLLPQAKQLNWRLGIRLLTSEEVDAENPQFPTQFGLAPDEAVVAMGQLLAEKARLETVHFHLRSNISSVKIYERAIAEVAAICQAANFSPRHLDIGGGVPVRNILTRSGKVFDGEFGLRSFAETLRQSVKLFPDLRELWLENGRFLSSGCGVLVVKILDVKERRGLRQFICDGGRTMNALHSLWEQHALIPLWEHGGELALTVVHGPTCMAFDQLARIQLPRSLQAGDYLLWLDAGSYHLPWETRFSHGHAAVCWHDESGMHLVRESQSFANHWSQWK
jgi:diaminopimelate decarboxylase